MTGNATADQVAQAVTQGEQIARILRGRSIEIPDLGTYFKKLADEPIHADYPKLVGFVNELLERTLDDPGRIETHKKQDFAFFTALWFPKVDYEKLQCLACYVTWLFLWDDTVDTAEYELADDLSKATDYRNDTVLLWKEHLGIQAGAAKDVKVDGINGLIKEFCDRGQALMKPGEDFQELINSNTLYHEMVMYITACTQEHQLRTIGVVPAYDFYVQLRLQTTAMYTLTAMADFVVGRRVSGFWTSRHETERRRIWLTTNYGIIFVNDLMSLKKELKTGCVISAVGCLVRDHMQLESAVDFLVDQLRIYCNILANYSVDKEELLAKLHNGKITAEEWAEQDLMQDYREVCTQMVTANWRFSLSSARYGLKQYTAEDNSLKIVL